MHGWGAGKEFCLSTFFPAFYYMWFFLLDQPLVVVCVILQHVHFCFCSSSNVLTVVRTQQTAGR